MTIEWKKSKEGTLEGYVDDKMMFDINKEQGMFAVYEMKRSVKSAFNRPDFSSIDLAKKYCNSKL